MSLSDPLSWGQRVCGSEDILCRFQATALVKGKAEPLEIYRVVWREEDVGPSAEPKVRVYDALAEKKVMKPLKVLQFLKVSSNTTCGVLHLSQVYGTGMH